MGVRLALGAVAWLSGVSLGQGDSSGPANGHIVVSTRADGAIVLLDPVTFAESARMLAPVGLHEIAAAPDARRAIGSAYGSGPRHQTPDQRLLVINLPDLDPATDDVLSVGPMIDLGSKNVRPNDLVVLPDSNRVYCTSEMARTVLTIDMDAATASAQPPAPPAQVPVSSGGIAGEASFGSRAGHMLASSADGSRVWVPSVSDGSVAVLDMTSGRVEAWVETAPGAEGIAAAPDGSTVWVACNRSNRIFVIDAASHAVLASLEAPGFPFRVRFTPDSSRVVVTFPGENEVRMYDARSREVVRSFDVGEGAMPTSVAVSPDGTMAAVTCGGLESVAVLDLESGGLAAMVRVGVAPDGLAWAPAPAAVSSASAGE